MATEQEVIQLIMKVVGEQEVKDLAKTQKELKKALDDAVVATKSSDAATVAADANVKKAAADLADHTAKYQAATAAAKANTVATKAVADATEKTTNKMAGFGQSALQASRAFQDFTQGGIGGVLNNIEGLAQAMGGGPGLAGVMTAVGVAAFIARPYIDDLFKSFKDQSNVDVFGDSIERVKTRIKELEDKKIRLAIDDAELKRLTKEVEDLTKAAQFANQLLNKQTKAESASGRAVEDAIVETPGAQEAIANARRDAINKALTESVTIKENRAKIAEKEPLLAEQNKLANDKNAGEGARLVAAGIARNLRKELEALREANKKAIDELVIKEGDIFDQIEKDAISGKGKVQAAAQKKLTGILGAGSDAGKIVADNSPQRVVAKEAADLEADAQFDRVEESNARAKAFRLKQAAERKKGLKEASDDADAQFASVEESNARAKAFRLKMRAAAKKESGEQQSAVKEFVDQFDGKAILNTIGQSMSQGMSDDALKEHTAKFLARNTNIPPEQRAAVAAGLVGKVRENFDAFKAERAAMGMQFGGQALGGMPQFQGGKRLVGKRNMALRAKARAKSKGIGGLPEITPFRGLAPVPSIGKMPELKIDGVDKTASLMETQVGQNKEMIATLQDIARRSGGSYLS